MGGEDRGRVNPEGGFGGRGWGCAAGRFAAAEREIKEAAELEALDREAEDSSEGGVAGRSGVPPIDWDLSAQLEAEVRAFEEERGFAFDAIAGCPLLIGI